MTRHSLLIFLSLLLPAFLSAERIKFNKDGSPKQIKDKWGKWLKPLKLYDGQNVTIFSPPVMRDNNLPSEEVRVLGFDSYQINLLRYDKSTRQTTVQTAVIHPAKQTVALIDEATPHHPLPALAMDKLDAPTAAAINMLNPLVAAYYPEAAQEFSATGCSLKPQVGPMLSGGKMKAPVVEHFFNPEFTEEARRARYSASVLLTLVVDTDGNTKCIHVLQHEPYGLDQQSIDAISKYKFRPATRDGVPVPVVLNMETSFSIF